MKNEINLKFKKIDTIESIIKIILKFFAFLSVIITISIIFSFLYESFPFFDNGRLFKLFSYGELWDPRSDQYSILPILIGTLMILVFSCMLAIPLGLGTSIYLSEYASPKARNIMKPILEILAGIPSVVYGYFALLYITPFLKNNITWLAKVFLIFTTLFLIWVLTFFIKKVIYEERIKTKIIASIFALIFTILCSYELLNFFRLYKLTNSLEIETFNVLSASIAVGIMIVPLVASISEDALKSVPNTLREAAIGLGATKCEMIVNTLIPSAISGIASAFILGMSRAIGETMIVTMAAGSKPILSFNPLGQIQTMTGYMVNKTFGEVVVGSIEYRTVFVVGLILFLITLFLNVIAKKIVDINRLEY